MPNYLARVAAAGARTTFLARPPVRGPVLLPGLPAAQFPVGADDERNAGAAVVRALPSAPVPSTPTSSTVGYEPTQQGGVEPPANPASPSRREPPPTEPA